MSSATHLDLASIKVRRQATWATGDYRDLRNLARSWTSSRWSRPCSSS
jgi:hypothetical protein